MKMIKYVAAPLFLLLAFRASGQSLQLPPHEPFAFKLSADKLQLSRGAEQSINLNVVKSNSNTKGKVKLAVVSSLPPGLTVKFSVNNEVLYASVVSVSTTDQTAPGTYSIIISCTIGSKSK